MDNIITYLMGKKTFICAALAGLVTLIYALGIISQSTWQILMGLLVPAAAAALRDAQNTAHAQVMDKVTQIAAVQQVASAQVAQVQGSVDAVSGQVAAVKSVV